MLPFLKQKMEGSVSQPPTSIKRDSDEPKEDDFDSLEVAMEELFKAKDNKERAAAFRAAFDLLEKEPHEEVSHE